MKNLNKLYKYIKIDYYNEYYTNNIYVLYRNKNELRLLLELRYNNYNKNIEVSFNEFSTYFTYPKYYNLPEYLENLLDSQDDIKIQLALNLL